MGSVAQTVIIIMYFESSSVVVVLISPCGFCLALAQIARRFREGMTGGRSG